MNVHSHAARIRFSCGMFMRVRKGLPIWIGRDRDPACGKRNLLA
jgi:hypothetical protein